jgi:hypothetical protein
MPLVLLPCWHLLPTALKVLVVIASCSHWSIGVAHGPPADNYTLKACKHIAFSNADKDMLPWMDLQVQAGLHGQVG